MKTWSLVGAILVLTLVGSVYVLLYPPFPDSGWTYRLPDGTHPGY